MLAIYPKKEELADFLLEKKADITIQINERECDWEWGMSALSYAANKGNAKIAKKLLQLGADPSNIMSCALPATPDPDDSPDRSLRHKRITT